MKEDSSICDKLFDDKNSTDKDIDEEMESQKDYSKAFEQQLVLDQLLPGYGPIICSKAAVTNNGQGRPRFKCSRLFVQASLIKIQIIWRRT